jgi:hypothetical protein
MVTATDVLSRHLADRRGDFLDRLTTFGWSFACKSQKWGNSLAIRLPATVVAALERYDDGSVNLIRAVHRNAARFLAKPVAFTFLGNCAVRDRHEPANG